MPLEPTDAEIIAGAIDARLLDLHTCAPGKIHSYDAEKQVADIELVQNRPLTLADGTIIQEELPVIPNVQVCWPRAGGYSMHFPLAVGDHVIVVFTHASITAWRDTGQTGPVGDLRRHSLDGAFCIPGVAPDGDVIAPTDAPATGEAVLNGPAHFRVGAPSADWVAHATSTKAAIDALQAQITALQTECAGLQVEIAAVSAAGVAAFAIPGVLAGAHVSAFAAAPTAVTAGAAIVTAQAAIVVAQTAAAAAQELLIASTKLKAE